MSKLPMAKQLDLAVTPWDTLGSGVLTGKYNRDPEFQGRAALRGRVKKRDLGIAEEVVKLAEQIGPVPDARIGDGEVEAVGQWLAQSEEFPSRERHADPVRSPPHLHPGRDPPFDQDQIGSPRHHAAHDDEDLYNCQDENRHQHCKLTY